MGVLRTVFLAGAQSRWLRERAGKYEFIRQAVSRFMPGETVDAALAAASDMKKASMGAVLTYLGENISDRSEAESVTRHYIEVLNRIQADRLQAEVSAKLTQLGLDLDQGLCQANLEKIIHSGRESTVWIDMEASNYVDVTLDMYRRALKSYRNVGVCLQSYLYRTARDLDSLIPLAPAIRLVKGAYREPANLAFPRKRDVDENYFTLAKTLLGPAARAAGVRAAIATHDKKLIRRIIDFAASSGVVKHSVEFQMLYGIQRAEQARLARAGYNVRVLISYGSDWFPWFMRRLAERPANVLFVIRNLF